MEFELMIPFGVVIIIFATIICRKYIFKFHTNQHPFISILIRFISKL